MWWAFAAKVHTARFATVDIRSPQHKSNAPRRLRRHAVSVLDLHAADLVVAAWRLGGQPERIRFALGQSESTRAAMQGEAASRGSKEQASLLGDSRGQAPPGHEIVPAARPYPQIDHRNRVCKHSTSADA